MKNVDDFLQLFLRTSGNGSTVFRLYAGCEKSLALRELLADRVSRENIESLRNVVSGLFFRPYQNLLHTFPRKAGALRQTHDEAIERFDDLAHRHLRIRSTEGCYLSTVEGLIGEGFIAPGPNGQVIMMPKMLQTLAIARKVLARARRPAATA